MPETTENYHRIPVSSGHSNHDIKTIDINSAKGIKALYCTDCKEIVTYLFDVDKWTMEEAKEWVENHKGFDEPTLIAKGVVPFHSYPKASENTAWNGPGEVAKADVDDLKKMCTWYDGENPDVKSSYKLPHHKASGYTTVWNGVRAAMSRLYQQGTKIPDSDRKGCYNHLAKHYKEFDKEPPEWGKEYSDDEFLGFFGADNMDKRIDRRTKDKIGSRVRYKSYGTFVPKGAGGSSDDIYVRGFFTSDEMDEVGDIITKEATVNAVEKWRQWGNIRTMHDSPSGRIDKIGEADGLAWNEVVTVPVEENTKRLIEGGVLKAYSVGIIPREYELNEDALREQGDDIDPWFFPLIIHSYDMVEISYVDHPANYAATIQEIGGETKDMSHKSVLFKNSEVMGDIIDMDKVEKDAEMLDEELDEEVLEELEAEDVSNPDESDGVSEEESLDKGEEADEESDMEPETEKEEGAEEEEVVEKDEEETFDVALAVGEIKGSLEGLEERVSNLADSMDNFVDLVVERFMDAMTALEDDVDTEELDEETEEKSFDEDAFIERVSEKVLSGLAEMLVPAVSRSAKVRVDDSDAGEEESTVDKTKRYMEMTPAERRAEMKQVLSEKITNK